MIEKKEDCTTPEQPHQKKLKLYFGYDDEDFSFTAEFIICNLYNTIIIMMNNLNNNHL